MQFPLKTIQFWVKENQKRKRVPSFLLAGTEYDRRRRSGGFGLEPKNPMFRTQSPNPHKIKNETRRKDKSKETKEQTDEEVEEEDRVCFAAYDGGRAHEVQAFRPGLDFTE